MSAALPLAFVNSMWGWIAILFIALLLFGARLPKMARNMGKGINEFKKEFTTSEGKSLVEADADAMDADKVGHETVKVNKPAPKK